MRSKVVWGIYLKKICIYTYTLLYDTCITRRIYLESFFKQDSIIKDPPKCLCPKGITVHTSVWFSWHFWQVNYEGKQAFKASLIRASTQPRLEIPWWAVPAGIADLASENHPRTKNLLRNFGGLCSSAWYIEQSQWFFFGIALWPLGSWSLSSPGSFNDLDMDIRFFGSCKIDYSAQTSHQLL